MGLSASPNKLQTETADANAASTIRLHQRFILPIVTSDEIEVALNDFPVKGRSKLRDDVTNGNYRLLWLTAWDWDTAEDDPANTVLISSDVYRQLVKLNNRRTRIAIREPKSGYIEMRGLYTVDGNISISMLSGTQPIALPVMAPGKITQINVVAAAANAASIDIPVNIPSLSE